MNRRASCVGTFEVFEAAHVALRTLLAFSQPVNCIFWPIGMLNWLVAASKLHKHRGRHVALLSGPSIHFLFYGLDIGGWEGDGSYVIVWIVKILMIMVHF